MSIRENLRLEIEDTQEAFHQLLESIPDKAFGLPSDNPAWTIGEVLYHMSIAPRMLGTDVKMILNQNWFYRLIPAIIPKRLFDWLNKILTKFGARNLTRKFLASEYDKAHLATLKALDEVKEADFEKKLIYPDWDPLLSGEVTLERLFHYIKLHFDVHVAQIHVKLNEAKGDF
jgi:hypothetical protein